jgi:hypothetical protein
VVSFRRGGLWRGLGTVLAGIVAAALVAFAAMYLIAIVRPGSFWRAYPVWTDLAVYACGLLAAVAGLVTIGRRLTVEQLRPSFWLAFLLLGAAVLLIAPGGVIYFLLPPLVALGGILLRRWMPLAERIGAILAAVLLWLTFGELLALLGQLITDGPFFIFAPLAMIIAMPWLIEAKPLLDSSGRRPAIGISAALALLGWAAVAAAPAYSADRQQRFVIQHATETGGSGAYWSIVNDGAHLPNAYGGVGGWRRDELPNVEGKRWIAPTATIGNLRAPRLELLGNQRRGKLRTVTLRLWPNGAESVTLIAAKDAQIVSAGTSNYVEPISADATGKYYLSCFGRSCENATFQFTTTRAEPVGFTLLGSRRGLPAIARPLVEQRPRFARPQYSPDATLTISRISL